MKKQLKDLFVFKEGTVMKNRRKNKIIEVYYDNKFLGHGIFVINKNFYIMSSFIYHDFNKYFGLTERDFLNMIVKYVTNTSEGVEVNTDLFWWVN